MTGVQCRDCDLRVGDRVAVTDPWQEPATGEIVAVNTSHSHGCVQVRTDAGTLTYVLCPHARVIEPDACRVHGIARCTICLPARPAWWNELAAQVEATGLERFSTAWYEAMRDAHAARFPDSDLRTRDNLELLVAWSTR